MRGAIGAKRGYIKRRGGVVGLCYREYAVGGRSTTRGLDNVVDTHTHSSQELLYRAGGNVPVVPQYQTAAKESLYSSTNPSIWRILHTHISGATRRRRAISYRAPPSPILCWHPNKTQIEAHSTAHIHKKKWRQLIYFFFFSLMCICTTLFVRFCFDVFFFLLIKIRKKFSSKVIGCGIIIFEMKSNSEDSADVCVCAECNTLWLFCVL